MLSHKTLTESLCLSSAHQDALTVHTSRTIMQLYHVGSLQPQDTWILDAHTRCWRRNIGGPPWYKTLMPMSSPAPHMPRPNSPKHFTLVCLCLYPASHSTYLRFGIGHRETGHFGGSLTLRGICTNSVFCLFWALCSQKFPSTPATQQHAHQWRLQTLTSMITHPLRTWLTLSHALSHLTSEWMNMHPINTACLLFLVFASCVCTSA